MNIVSWIRFLTIQACLRLLQIGSVHCESFEEAVAAGVPKANLYYIRDPPMFVYKGPKDERIRVSGVWHKENGEYAVTVHRPCEMEQDQHFATALEMSGFSHVCHCAKIEYNGNATYAAREVVDVAPGFATGATVWHDGQWYNTRLQHIDADVCVPGPCCFPRIKRVDITTYAANDPAAPSSVPSVTFLSTILPSTSTARLTTVQQLSSEPGTDTSPTTEEYDDDSSFLLAEDSPAGRSHSPVITLTTFPVRQMSESHTPLTTLMTVINRTDGDNVTLVVLLNVTTGPSDETTLEEAHSKLDSDNSIYLHSSTEDTDGYVQRISATIKRKPPPWSTELRSSEVPVTVSLVLITSPRAQEDNHSPPTNAPRVFLKEAEKPNEEQEVVSTLAARNNPKTGTTVGVAQTDGIPTQPPQTSGSGMLIGIIVAVALLFLFCIIIVVWRKKRNQ